MIRNNLINLKTSGVCPGPDQTAWIWISIWIYTEGTWDKSHIHELKVKADLVQSD
jgi:hypothetical protein